MHIIGVEELQRCEREWESPQQATIMSCVFSSGDLAWAWEPASGLATPATSARYYSSLPRICQRLGGRTYFASAQHPSLPKRLGQTLATMAMDSSEAFVTDAALEAQLQILSIFRTDLEQVDFN